MVNTNERDIREQVALVKDRTTFEAFHAIQPDEVYTRKQPKCHVVYSPSVKYTVVLVFKEAFIGCWMKDDNAAIQELESEFNWHRGQTVLIKKMTSKILLNPLTAFHPAAGSFDKSPEPVQSMRLIHKYQD